MTNPSYVRPEPDVHDDDSNGNVDREEKLFQELRSKYESAICTAAVLETKSIKPRKPIAGKWMKEGDLGFVYGARGSGKTWLVDALCTHISTGCDLFDWQISEALTVLYVDGEMPCDDARERIKGMTPGNERLYVLHHEVLFDLTGLDMNLTNPRTQRVITEICLAKDIKLLVLDNLSCLFSDMKENDADEWEKVLRWLLDLRRRRIAVLIVAHAGRAGTMRGTSRREDSCFWVIKVEERDRAPNEPGAKFHTTFEKQRNSQEPEWIREWYFNTEPNGAVTMSCDEISFDQKVFQLIDTGITSASCIAEELKTSKATVCRAAKRLIDQKLIDNNGRNYRVRGVLKS